jgi:PilZ domain
MSEKRAHERTHCFLVPTDEERVRFWVLKPAADIDARAGVILDASDSGMRILVDPSGDFEGGHYRVRLLVDPPVECTMKLIWCEPDGDEGYMAGMQFDTGAPEVVAYIAAHPPAADKRTWISCTLRPA